MARLTRQRVMEFFSNNPRPVSMRDMSWRMGLSSPAQRALKKIIRQLVSDGELLRTKRGLYGPPDKMEIVNGYFESHREGYGFVILESPGQRDVFIPARDTMNAMSGDRVSVTVTSHRRRSGRVVRIMERVHKKIAGVVDKSAGSCFVRPKSNAINFDIHIPDDSAPLCKEAEQGQPVLVEIDAYPSEKRPALGRIIKLLERPSEASEDVESIIDEFGLPRAFPSEVTAAAKEAAGRGITGERTDLSELATVTIDGETAKDFDDAVSVRLEPKGGYTLWVHIADVSHYVTEGSLIDQEAAARGTSVYFPGMVIPMLPEALSEDICSLRPSVKRAAFTVEMSFNAHGMYKGAKFYPSLIVSDERMTYTSVKKIIVDYDPDERQKYAGLVDDFDLMEKLARLLRKQRMARGSLDFDLPEPEVLLDIRGNPEAIVKGERNFAHMLIEEFMIAANESVATFMEDKALPCLFRIHEEPDPMKVADVMRLAGVKMSKKRVLAPDGLKKVVDAIKDTPIAEAVNYMILRSMKQARYSETNVGHFGLASESYCHFTSPIRRYPDLIVHRILRQLIEHKRMPDEIKRMYAEDLPETAFHSSRRERLAMEAEREVMDSMRVWFMSDKVGHEFGAIVTGVTPRGMRLRLDDFYVEGFVSLSDMTDDYYAYNEDMLSLIGQNNRKVYRFGEAITVRVEKVDFEERRIIFGMAGMYPA